MIELKKPIVICPVGNNRLANAIQAVFEVFTVILVAKSMMASSQKYHDLCEDIL